MGTAAYTSSDDYELTGAASALSNALGTAAFVDTENILAASAVRGLPDDAVLLVSDLIIDSAFSNETYALPDVGLHSLIIESNIDDPLLLQITSCNYLDFVPPGTNTLVVLSACATNIVLGKDLFLPNPAPPEGITNTVFALYAVPYRYPEVLTETNDFRTQRVLVREPTDPYEPVPFGHHQQSISAIRVDRWSDHVAVTPVDLDGRPLRFGDNFAAQAVDYELRFTWNDNTFLRFHAGASAVGSSGDAQVVSFELAGDEVTMGVQVPTGWAPWPEYSTNVSEGVWEVIETFASTFPTQTYGVVYLTFDAIADAGTVFYRASATNSEMEATSTLEVTADRFLLVGKRIEILDTNAQTVVKIDADTGLTVGTATTVIGPTGDIAQNPTNTAALGLVTVESIAGDGSGLTDLPLDGYATTGALAGVSARVDGLDARTNDWNAAYAATTNLSDLAYADPSDYYTSQEIDDGFVAHNATTATVGGVTLEGGNILANQVVADNLDTSTASGSGTWTFDGLQVGTNTVHTTGTFNPSLYVTVASFQANLTNYARRVSVPASNTAFGVAGYYAVSGTHVYHYVPQSNMWGRIAIEMEW